MHPGLGIGVITDPECLRPRSSQARMLLRDGDDSQVLPRQDGDHEALHRGGGDVVPGHDGPLVRRAFVKVETWRRELCLTRGGFAFQDNSKRKAMLRAFEKHNKLMAEAQEAQGELTLLPLYFLGLNGQNGF